MTTIKEWIERGQKVVMNTYRQVPLAFVKGEGVYLWDADGKKYLDFGAGIAVNSLGFADPEWVAAISKQAATLHHTSNLYWIPPQIEFAELLVENSGFNRVFFCNSGAEAIEGAIKLAKKYAFKKKGENCNEVISMQHSFHGRTMATVTLTGQTKYQKGFTPLYPGVSYVEYNDIDALKKAVTDKSAAILLEPIQGEGGIRPAKKEYLQQVRQLCNEKDIVLIYDEVQCGMGRTGKLFAYQYYDVMPDIVSLAKGTAGGFPIGVMLATQSKADAFEPGDHASTFGGNYLACTAGKVTVEKFLKGGILKNVEAMGKYLTEKLIALQKDFPIIIDVRGVGLIQGIEFKCAVKDIINKCLADGLILIAAGDTVIRFVPPLIIGKTEIDSMITTLRKILPEFVNAPSAIPGAH